MSTLQMVLAGVVVVLLLAGLWLRQRDSGGSVAEKKAADRIDTIIGWPPQATRVLSTQERLAFSTLVRALPEYMILAQVPLARFLNVPKRNSYADWLRRVGYQSVDFAVCDMAAQVIGVVELQPPQLTERARKRLTRIARTLKAAQIPLHTWRENALPTVDAAREVLLPKQPAPMVPLSTPIPGLVSAAAAATTVAAAVPAAAEPAAAPAVNPFADTDRDSTQDELIELLEPPPSTWFDDLDSDPIPLSKR